MDGQHKQTIRTVARSTAAYLRTIIVIGVLIVTLASYKSISHHSGTPKCTFGFLGGSVFLNLMFSV